MDQWPVRKPLRMRGYDYSTPGTYFITICVQHMESRFGEVTGDSVKLNEAGVLIAAEWVENASKHSGIELDLFVVMPNHLHAVVFTGTDPKQTIQNPGLSRLIQSFKSSSTVKYIAGVKDGRSHPFIVCFGNGGFTTGFFAIKRHSTPLGRISREIPHVG